MTNDTSSVDAAMKFIVRSELMQDYFVGSPYQAQPVVASVLDGDGVVQIFSLGSDQDIYNLYPDSDAKDG